MSATAPQAKARCDPDTATRCVNPKTRKSSSAGVFASLRLSPSTMPSSRSPPAPPTSFIRCSTLERHENSRPLAPGRHDPACAFHAVPVAHTPPRATRRLQASSAGRSSITAENRTVLPSAAEASSLGHHTRTRAPSSGPPTSRTRIPDPWAEGAGSASTYPVHSRAPHSSAILACRCQDQPCTPETARPATKPSIASLGRDRLWETASPHVTAHNATVTATADHRIFDPQYIRHETSSATTQPAHIASANQQAGGTDGLDGRSSLVTPSSPGRAWPRTSSGRSRVRA